MTASGVWPTAVKLRTTRLFLEPLRPAHAAELAPLLDDVALHTFIGGEPASERALKARYERQAVGHSSDGAEAWLNWVVRRRDDGGAVGTVQATVRHEAALLSAEVAWVVVRDQQRQGFATEAALRMAEWLRDRGVLELAAHVHPDHEASQRVARALGLHPTGTIVDGEIVWRSGVRPALTATVSE